MTKTALLFPGQGAQFVGMGKDLAETYPKAAEVFQKANDLLGIDLRNICFEGPAEELNRTDISQPAILAHSWAVYEVLKDNQRGKDLLQSAEVCAGLSLGEYSALAAAGAIAWADALKLVHKRGQFMQEACDAKPSTMASVLGLDTDKLQQACDQASELGVVVQANFNAEGQIVISGEIDAVAKAGELAKEAGAKRVIPLEVAGAFHSPVMEPARARLEAEIEATDFAMPQISVVANVSATALNDAATAKASLVKQLTAPVLWANSMAKLVEEGFDRFIEIGPGNVLAGLLRRAARDAEKLSIGTTEQVEALTSQGE